jgi:DNA-binding FrmR family transcriptional regulator
MKNPCHKKQIASLKRIEGQVRGVVRMIEAGEYCVDILNQTKAAKSALISVETKVMERHLLNCVHESFSNPDTRDVKIKELINLLKR